MNHNFCFTNTQGNEIFLFFCTKVLKRRLLFCTLKPNQMQRGLSLLVNNNGVYIPCILLGCLVIIVVDFSYATFLFFFKQIFGRQMSSYGTIVTPVLNFCDISSGFQSQSGKPYFHLKETYMWYTLPEVHLWCNTCQNLVGMACMATAVPHMRVSAEAGYFLILMFYV